MPLLQRKEPAQAHRTAPRPMRVKNEVSSVRYDNEISSLTSIWTTFHQCLHGYARVTKMSRGGASRPLPQINRVMHTQLRIFLRLGVHRQRLDHKKSHPQKKCDNRGIEGTAGHDGASLKSWERLDGKYLKSNLLYCCLLTKKPRLPFISQQRR